MKVLHAWHDGYSHLLEGPGKILHERQVIMIRDRYWMVADLIRVEGEGEFTFDQNWRFMPTELQRRDDYSNAVSTAYDGANVAIIPLAGIGEIVEEAAWFSPKYGVKYPAPRLSFRHRSGNGWFFVTLLAPFEGDEISLEGMQMQPGENSVQGRMSWKDGHIDAVRVSFGKEPGEGETSWKGWLDDREIGRETVN